MAKQKQRIRVADERMIGVEPVFSSEPTSEQLGNAYYWFTYSCTQEDAKKFILEYLKENGRTKEHKVLSKVSELMFSMTVAAIARMLTMESKLSQKTLGFFEKKISEYVSRYDVETVEKNIPSVFSRVENQVDSIISDIEEEVDKLYKDEKHKFDLYDFLNKREVKSKQASMIAEFYQKYLVEYQHAVNKTDPDITEAYARFPKEKLKSYVAFFKTLVEDANKFSGVQKKTIVRKPRKAKQKSAEQIVSKLNYKPKDDNFKIASVNPEEVVGSQEVWVFNTKYRTLGVYKAKDLKGIAVKGSTLENFVEEEAFSKTVRKPDLILKEVLESTKPRLKKIMPNIKAKPAPLTGRINKETVILRVVK